MLIIGIYKPMPLYLSFLFLTRRIQRKRSTLTCVAQFQSRRKKVRLTWNSLWSIFLFDWKWRFLFVATTRCFRKLPTIEQLSNTRQLAGEGGAWIKMIDVICICGMCLKGGGQNSSIHNKGGNGKYSNARPSIGKGGKNINYCTWSFQVDLK